MTTLEFTLFVLEDSGNQVSQAFEGLSERAWDTRLCDESMTPREMATHLCECYEAYAKHLQGVEHEWGTYMPEHVDSADLLNTMRTKRADCIQRLRQAGTDDAMKSAIGYLALHDAYHVGQLASIRISVEPDWDPYSIYPK